MTFISRAVTAALVAGAALLPLAPASVFAQGATVGPAGGVPSTTAPSNSQGTPAGGTGTLSTTRVGPSGTMTQVAPTNTAPMATSTTPARRRHHHHRRSHRSTQTGTQSQSGLNAAPAK